MLEIDRLMISEKLKTLQAKGFDLSVLNSVEEFRRRRRGEGAEADAAAAAGRG